MVVKVDFLERVLPIVMAVMVASPTVILGVPVTDDMVIITLTRMEIMLVIILMIEVVAASLMQTVEFPVTEDTI